MISKFSKIKKELFFLDAESSRLFAIYNYPEKAPTEKRAIIYIHPFADEMNKSRRMAALQAQAFARLGFGVLQIDLYGCGDSSGEFSDARWNIWKYNITIGVKWLIKKGIDRISLWGLRMGALLIMDWNINNLVPIETFILWHPVLNGNIAIKQYLRMTIASQMIGKDRKSTNEIREMFNQGQNVEVGGYLLHPEMVASIEGLKMENLYPPKGSRILWNEISLNSPPEITPASKKTIGIFERNGSLVNYQAINGQMFWNSVEISTVTDLITTTTGAMTGYFLK